MGLKQLPVDFKEFIECLKNHNVRYLLVGGWAVGLYGNPRATKESGRCRISGKELSDSSFLLRIKKMTEYYQSIKNAIGFIEKNLRNPLTIEDVSREAFQSRWHFQRVFRLVTGYSVYEYIKRRRLAEAGSELILQNRKIMDVALKYQYNSPEAADPENARFDILIGVK